MKIAVKLLKSRSATSVKCENYLLVPYYKSQKDLFFRIFPAELCQRNIYLLAASLCCECSVNVLVHAKIDLTKVNSNSKKRSLTK